MLHVNSLDLIRAIINRHEKFLNLEANTIYFDYMQDVEVLADQIKIEQVIYNLLTNAIHHSTDGKKVFMYEDSDELKELKYSRSFQIFYKYYRYKRRKKKTI